MPNTLLYQDIGTEDFVYSRPWDGGKGSSTVYSGSLRALAEDMKRFGDLFEEPFDPVKEVFQQEIIGET